MRCAVDTLLAVVVVQKPPMSFAARRGNNDIYICLIDFTRVDLSNTSLSVNVWDQMFV